MTEHTKKSASAAPPASPMRVAIAGVKPQTVLFRWDDLARTLFAARGIDSGLWHVGVLMHFAAASAQWEVTRSPLPTGTVGVAGVTLTPTSEPGPMVFDAQALSKLQANAPRPGELLMDFAVVDPETEKQPDPAVKRKSAKRGPADRSKISLAESWEVSYWTKALKVTEAQLRAAVKAVGNGVPAVRAHLLKK